MFAIATTDYKRFTTLTIDDNLLINKKILPFMLITYAYIILIKSVFNYKIKLHLTFTNNTNEYHEDDLLYLLLLLTQETLIIIFFLFLLSKSF